MKMTVPWLILGVMVFCLRCDRHRSAVGEPEANGIAADRSTEKQPDVWTCPMHPEIRRDRPGSCPICSMALVKARAEPTSSGSPRRDDWRAPFALSFSRQQMIGVKVGTVEKKELFRLVEAPGRVAFDPELFTAQNEYLEAVKQEVRVRNSSIDEVHESAHRAVESAKLRLKILGLSDQQIRFLQTSGASGVSLLVPKPGENLWVYAELFEIDLPYVEPGMAATIVSPAFGGGTPVGTVISVDRVINPNTRTAKVRISVPGAGLTLKPEAYVDVAIRSSLGEQITVPFDAVIDTGKMAWVFVVSAEQFEPRQVQISVRAGDELGVAAGVAPGERIVTSANFLVDSESRLQSAVTRQQAPKCPPGETWHEQMKHCMPEAGGPPSSPQPDSDGRP